MKTISTYAVMLLVGVTIATCAASYIWTQKKQKWMLAIELDRVTYSYAPLNSLQKGNTEEAKELLLSHLDDALIHYDKAAQNLPGWNGTNVALIRGARALYTEIMKNKNSEQAAGVVREPRDGSRAPQP